MKKCVNDKIETFNSKGTRNKKGAGYAQLAITILSVATPVLIGWKVNNNNAALLSGLANAALICSALAAGLSTLYNFFDYKDLWVQYKVTRNELESILAEIEYLEASGNVTQDDLAKLFKGYVKTCVDTNSFYRDTRLGSNETNTPIKLA